MVSLLACAEGSGASSSRLGMGPPGEAGSREVGACRGGDVEAGVQAILMNLAEIGLHIYPSAGFLYHRYIRAAKPGRLMRMPGGMCHNFSFRPQSGDRLAVLDMLCGGSHFPVVTTKQN